MDTFSANLRWAYLKKRFSIFLNKVTNIYFFCEIYIGFLATVA